MDKQCRYKVPFRRCYTDNFLDWVKYTLWCHIVLRIWPTA